MIEQYLEALTHGDSAARSEAAKVLGDLRDPAAVDALLRCLQDDDAKLQYAAFSALVKIGSTAAAPAMVAALLNNPQSRLWGVLKLNVGLRLRAGLLNIVQRGDTETADKLTNALEQEHFDPYQTVYLLHLLGRTGDRRAVESLITTLREDTELMQSAAADALGWMGDVRAVPALIIALETLPTESAAREVAAEALGRIGEPQAITALVKGLTDGNEWVRRASAVALGEIGDQMVVDSLTNALDDESAMVQEAAAEAIKQLSN